MPYNGAGIFTILNTFVPGTTIKSTDMNANFTDIAAGLSDCLTRDGQAPMTAPLKLINGNSGGPALSFASEPTLGFYRKSAALIGLNGGLDVSGALSATSLNVAGNPIQMIGEVRIWSGVTAPPLWLICNGQSLLRATYPALWTFAANQIANGNLLYTNGNGSTTFTIPDTSGRVVAGRDIGTNRLTAATMTPDGNTMGAVSGNNQIVTLTTAQIPNHKHDVFLNDPGHTHGFGAAGSQANIGGTGAAGTTPQYGTTSNQNISATTGMTVRDTSGGGGTANQTGNQIAAQSGGGSHTNVQPTVLFHYILYAGV